MENRRRFLILRLSFRSCQFFIFFNFSPICGVYPSAAIFVSCENDGLCFRVLSVFLVKNICINSEKCIGYGKQRTTTTPEARMCVTLRCPQNDGHLWMLCACLPRQPADRLESTCSTGDISTQLTLTAECKHGVETYVFFAPSFSVLSCFSPRQPRARPWR